MNILKTIFKGKVIMGVNTKVITVSLPIFLVDRTREEAKKRQLTLSKFVSICITRYIKDHPAGKTECSYGVMTPDFCADCADRDTCFIREY